MGGFKQIVGSIGGSAPALSLLYVDFPTGNCTCRGDPLEGSLHGSGNIAVRASNGQCMISTSFKSMGSARSPTHAPQLLMVNRVGPNTLVARRITLAQRQ